MSIRDVSLRISLDSETMRKTIDLLIEATKTAETLQRQTAELLKAIEQLPNHKPILEKM